MMKPRHPPLPSIWLVSDARNDERLERALKRLPRGSGLIFRHYHLDPARRRARWARLVRIARSRSHLVALSWTGDRMGSPRPDAVYGPPKQMPKHLNIPRLVTAHSLREIGAAQRSRADAIVLSPVYPTRSHPGGKALGVARFRLLAARAQMPVIALGGMTARRARSLMWKKWAAIDGI